METRVKEHVLENGMRFLILERHDAPVVSFTTVVNVSSVVRHVGITGVAHVFDTWRSRFHQHRLTDAGPRPRPWAR